MPRHSPVTPCLHASSLPQAHLCFLSLSPPKLKHPRPSSAKVQIPLFLLKDRSSACQLFSLMGRRSSKQITTIKCQQR